MTIKPNKGFLNAYDVKPGAIMVHCGIGERPFCVTEIERFDFGTSNYPNRPCIAMSLLASNGRLVRDYDISVEEFPLYWTLF